ncbi:MAG: EFR1 family ferrodoxin [Faecalibacillus sp.]
MILYFSGTGNSRFVAKHLGKILEDEVVSLNDILNQTTQKSFYSEKPFVFVTPSHMSRMPLKVENYLMNSHFEGNKNAYFIFTAGQAIGNASHYCHKICQKHHLIDQGTTAIQMPANYVVMYDVLDKKEATTKVQEIIPAIEKIGKTIKNNDILKNDQLRGHKMFGAFAPVFHTVMVSAKKFKINGACIGCKKCVEICPLNNIQLIEGKPVWNDQCMHCMACISICPQEIIQYGNKTKNRKRYYLNG